MIKNGKKSIFLALPLGFIVEWLIFQIYSVPMTFLGCTFYSLRNIWIITIAILAVISIIINFKDFKNIFKVNIDDIKTMPKILTILFLILLFVQCYASFKYMHEDYDDSNFVAKATIAIDTNSLFVYDDKGTEYTSFPTRYGFSQFPHYTAAVSTIVGVHPAIMAHTILPVILLILAYDVYYLIGMSLFKNDKNKAMTFLIILGITYMFGSYSRYSVYVRILYRAWQGKSVIACVILPFIWYLFLEYIGKEKKFFGWFLLMITLWGSVLLSSMALTLPIITAGILTVLYMIKDKKINYLFKLILCCLPSVIYGIIYLIVK